MEKIIIRVIIAAMSIVTVLAGELVIIDKGKSDYVIVIPKVPSKYEHFIANELVSHLEKISGVKLRVVRGNILPPGKKVISIGNTGYAKKAGINQGKLQDEEIIIRTTKEGNLILTGGRIRGTMYAVYDFLEKQLGCHWFDEYTFEIPRKERIAVPELNLEYHPYFTYRRISAPIYVDPTAWGKYILRNQGSDGPYLCEYDSIGEPVACHSFSDYAKNFPKGNTAFYAMDEKGVRQRPAGSSGAEFCMTNPEVVKNVTANLKKYILKDRTRYARYGYPPPPIYDISQNDGRQDYFCLCPSCRKVAKKYGGQSGLLVYFINRVADNIKDDFPGIYVQTFAYKKSQEPPKNIRPRDNVIIRYCATDDVFGAALDAPENKFTQRQIEGWSRISKNIGIWTYMFSSQDRFSMPFISANNYGRDFKYLASLNNVKTAYIQNYDYYKLSFFALQRWLMYQLMQNPQRNADKLIKIFMKGYYGGGAKAMTEYYNYLVEMQKELTYTFSSEEAKKPRKYLLRAEFYKKADAFLEKAEKTCEPGSRQLLNIHRERAIVDSAYLNLKGKLKTLPLDGKVVLDRYEKYRMELLDTVVPKSRRKEILPKIVKEIRKLRRGKELTKASQKTPPKMSIPRVMDNDWNKARVIKNWKENYGKASQKKITARLMHDGKNLKIRLEEDDIKRKLRDGAGEVWTGDDWELHFTGNCAKGNLRMIAIGPRNGSRALEIGRGPGGKPNGKNSALSKYAKVDSKIQGDSWIVDVVIPLDKLMPGGTVVGKIFYMNMFRSAAHLESAQAWSPTFQDSFHIPQRLGKAWLRP